MKPMQIVEAILFASDAPLNAAEIARADSSLDEDAVQIALEELRSDYDESERAFELVEIAEGYQVLTRAEFAPYIERFDTVPRPNRLSGPSLETLSIIAYRQPVGRIEIEYIRGVNSSGVIRTLLDRGLIAVVGRDEGLGRPLLYGTTQRFLEHFGFRSIEDLPRPEELPVVLRDRVALGPVAEAEEEEAPEGEGADVPTESGSAEGAPEGESSPDVALGATVSQAPDETRAAVDAAAVPNEEGAAASAERSSA